MENEINNKVKGRKITFTILIIFISVFIIYYSLMSMMSASRKLTAMKIEFGGKKAEKSLVDERIFSDSAYLELLKEKAFLQARTAMAETDSIYLTINLSDSTANIEISGVVVHKAKMSDVWSSKIFMKGYENKILSMLATPFTISDDIATIRKEPVMIKMAPKDTSEYKPDVMPDTSITEPVNYVLNMTNGTRIYFYQEEEDKFSERMNYFVFDIKNRLNDTWLSMKSVALFKIPEYHPYIKMKLPRADAKIIYRAIPKNGQIAVFRE